jgi:hypothetical protein
VPFGTILFHPGAPLLSDPKLPVLHCPICYSTQFFPSRIRREDLLQVLALKQPVRCRQCGKRLYASRAFVKWLRSQVGTPTRLRSDVPVEPDASYDRDFDREPEKTAAPSR